MEVKTCNLLRCCLRSSCCHSWLGLLYAGRGVVQFVIGIIAREGS